MGLRFPSIQFNLTPFRCLTRHACLIACLKLPELHSHFFLKYTHIQKSYFYKINILILIIKKNPFFFFAAAAALLRNGQLKNYIIYQNIQSFETEGNHDNLQRGAPWIVMCHLFWLENINVLTSWFQKIPFTLEILSQIRVQCNAQSTKI